MNREEAIRRMVCCRDFLANNYSDMGEPNITAFNMAIRSLEHEPCKDAISRQTVKDWFCTNYCSEHNKCEHFENGDCNAMIELFAIPSVNTEES